MHTQAAKPALLGTDQSNSVLHYRTGTGHHPVAYSPFGYHQAQAAALGFNGEVCEPVARGYLLGNGYRQFNPVLRRFYNPDAYSPFGAGGLNAYAYCVGDPVNNADPSGHLWGPLKKLGRALNIIPAKKISRAGSAVSLPIGHPGTSASSLAGHQNALSASVPAHLNHHVASDAAEFKIPLARAELQVLEQRKILLTDIKNTYKKQLKTSRAYRNQLTAMIGDNTNKLDAQRTWLTTLEGSAAAAVERRQAASLRPVPFDRPPAFEPPPLYASRDKADDRQFLADLNQYIRKLTNG